MATTYYYSDAYLAPLVTGDREARAIDDVAAYGTFSAAWTERLVRLRAYVIACVESSKSGEDLFAVKLAHYSKEFTRELGMARAATNASSSSTSIASLVSIPLERA
jgi:hypothetical protein